MRTLRKCAGRSSYDTPELELQGEDPGVIERAAREFVGCVLMSSQGGYRVLLMNR